MKSPVRVLLSALGNSPWIPLDYIQTPFGVTLACMPSSDWNGTYSVQYTYDAMDDQEDTLVSIARTTTSAAVVWPNHDMVTGDSVITYATGDANLDSAKDASRGNPIAQDITAVDASNFTYVVANSGAAAGGVNSKAKRLRVFTHAVLVAQTGRLDSNFNLPCQAVRLKVTAYVAGRLTMIVTQGVGP